MKDDYQANKSARGLRDSVFCCFSPRLFRPYTTFGPRLFRMYRVRAGAIQHSQSQLSHASLLVQPYHRPISIYNPYPSARFNFGHNLLFIRDTLNLWQQRLTKISFPMFEVPKRFWISSVLAFELYSSRADRAWSEETTDSISGQGVTKYVTIAANLSVLLQANILPTIIWWRNWIIAWWQCEWDRN